MYTSRGASLADKRIREAVIGFATNPDLEKGGRTHYIREAKQKRRRVSSPPLMILLAPVLIKLVFLDRSCSRCNKCFNRVNLRVFDRPTFAEIKTKVVKLIFSRVIYQTLPCGKNNFFPVWVRGFALHETHMTVLAVNIRKSEAQWRFSWFSTFAVNKNPSSHNYTPNKTNCRKEKGRSVVIQQTPVTTSPLDRTWKMLNQLSISKMALQFGPWQQHLFTTVNIGSKM